VSELKKVFPNITVIGNREKLNHMEGFDVYIRGVGLTPDLDETGRFILFSKNLEKRFPTAQEIVDKVIMLVLTYGDSFKLADAQEKFKKDNAKIISKPYKGMQKGLIPVPEYAVRKTPKKRVKSELRIGD
jgi:hypothetical protein